jgi:peptidoglycan L-alanyl-D-glutamate endopeptidase CwlK
MRENDPAHLHPVIRDAVILASQDLVSEKIPLKLFECFRSPERQAQLFAQGRSKQEPYAKMKIVTHAKAWHGPHGFGLAADFNPHINGKWTFILNDEWTVALREIGRKYGLLPIRNSAGKLIDPPHLQWRNWNQDDAFLGRYPEGWDDSWEQNLDATILRWGYASRIVLGINHPGAPPPVPCHVGADE